MVARSKSSPKPGLPPVRVLNAAESRAFIEAEAQRFMGMSADEFERKWQAGEIENPDRFEVLSVAILRGLG